MEQPLNPKDKKATTYKIKIEKNSLIKKEIKEYFLKNLSKSKIYFENK
jgi:hypothetical protein